MSLTRDIESTIGISNILPKLLLLIIGIVLLFSIPKIYEYVDANEIVLVQSVTGKMKWYTAPGPICQCFGSITSYPKRGTIIFDAKKITNDAGVEVWDPTTDKRLPIQFFDGAKGKIFGSLTYEPPMDDANLTEMHSMYPSPEALESGLVQPALNKTIYLSGNLMSSHESYKEQRTGLIQYIEDQVQNGVYLTTARQVEIIDPITEQKRILTRSEIRLNDAGLPLRTEDGQLSRFGVKAFNFAVEDLDYEDAVDQQIRNQQGITMAVETAIATAKQAQQNAITTKAEGEAAAAKAEWEQKTANAKIVAEALGRKDAADQDRQAAAFEKQAMLLRAEGQAEAKRKLMDADGALEPKLAAWLKAQEAWANGLASYQGNIVPAFSSGGSGGSSINGFNAFMETQAMKNAQELGLKMDFKKNQQ